MKVIVEPQVLGEDMSGEGSVLLLREWGSPGAEWHEEVKKALKGYPIAVFDTTNPDLTNTISKSDLHDSWVLNRINESSIIVMWFPVDSRTISARMQMYIGMAMYTGKLIMGMFEHYHRPAFENMCSALDMPLHETLGQVIEALLERLKPFKPIDYMPPLVRKNNRRWLHATEEFPIIDPETVKKDEYGRIPLLSFEPRAFANVAKTPKVERWWYRVQMIPNTLPSIFFVAEVADFIEEAERDIITMRTNAFYYGRYNLPPHKSLNFFISADGHPPLSIVWDGNDLAVYQYLP